MSQSHSKSSRIVPEGIQRAAAEGIQFVLQGYKRLCTLCVKNLCQSIVLHKSQQLLFIQPGNLTYFPVLGHAIQPEAHLVFGLQSPHMPEYTKMLLQRHPAKATLQKLSVFFKNLAPSACRSSRR